MRYNKLPMDNLKTILPKMQGKKVLVFGDVMLDEHIWSNVTRISPEAPIPIADVQRITHVPGGSGNVAANISALGAYPYLVGIIGQDSSGAKLCKALKQAHVPTQYLIKDNQRPTILKSRIIAGSQHVVRVDREDRTDLPNTLKEQIVKAVQHIIPLVDAVVISDYGKGLVTEETSQAVISSCRKYNKPVAVDPKGENYQKYRQATIITPNQKEASVASRINITDRTGLRKSGHTLLRQTKCKFILITRGKEGMSLFSSQSKEQHIPALARDVFDITGAGDTVIAVLTLTLAAGADMKDAVVLANIAASVVVGKVGTTPCSKWELEEAIAGHESIARKIKTQKELTNITKNLRSAQEKIVFTNGCFDILHLGHVRYLREAKKYGDVLIIGLNSDNSVKLLKGKDRPYVSELERAEILASLECVDYVVIFSESRPDNLIKLIKPDFHIKGGDYKAAGLPERKLVESLGGKVLVIPPIEGRSTTNIVKRILGK
ncbi:MAG: D-glycero-beta-D-manno-heptose-7-phosphate kinase [Candidatus Margulisbacteria bacterium]|nr:D-glycero-beta-D-manno-heptose-7-phosphate kinase [Candidatus Margulisiibacteriota bacterium]